MATDFVMRAMSLLALPTVVIAVQYEPSLCAWTCVARAVLVLIANLLTLQLSDV